MSREKVEVVRAIYDAFNRGDTDAILELVDPAVSVEDRAVIDGATYEGRDGALSFLAFQAEAFNAQSVELEEVVDTTDEIVAVILLRGEGPRSGVPLEGRFSHVWEVAGGVVRRLRVYVTKQEALEAAGRG
ncbi:MAG TPA: nuclear transport factor 2 family protein [Thermoleophilaceae bacterium]|nr:nuclear transport factor 2 family protein [Thermoleophilaceae bacterium]